MNKVIDWTYLPWDEQGTAGTVCGICLIIGVIFILVTQIIRRTNLGYNIHQAPFVSMEMAVLSLILNTAVFALFFWYAAIGISLVFSFAFYISGRGIQKNIYFEEKEGRWGLFPPLRKVRGELFADTSLEEQLEWKRKVDASFKKIHPLWFFPLTTVLPFIIILILQALGLPYIFVPHAI